MNRRQSGHALLIIVIVVLSLAILGVLGFLFWKNFINTSGTASTVTTFEECKASAGSKMLPTYPEQCVTSDGQTFVGPATKGESLKTYCTVAEKLCFEYLSDWKIEFIESQTEEAGASVDNLRVTSPDGLFNLTFISGISGLGGTCSEESWKPVYVLTPISIPGLVGYEDDYSQDQAVVSRSIYENDEGTYTAALYVTTAPDYARAGTLQTCGLAFSQFVQGKHSVISTDYDGAGVFRFGYTGSDFYNEASVSFTTVDEAEAVYETDNYTQAASLLATLRYE